MKIFNSNDLHAFDGGFILENAQENLILAPLQWQSNGYTQTVSGYGAKLTSRWKINFEGKLYRIYCTCYSNSASHWFTVKGKKVFVN